MKWLIAGGLAAVAIAITGKSVNKPELQYFKASEFGVWWPFMSNDLLVTLDRFRELWGAPVIISSANGGIGRRDDSNSQHNVLKWGEVRAVDFFPQVEVVEGLYGYIDNPDDLRRAQQVAIKAGFTGVGVYTDTKPGFMVHGDVRELDPVQQVATWSRINGDYYGAELAFA